MFTVTPNGENRLDIEIKGKIDTEIMASALDALAEHSKDITHGKMLYTLTDFNWPSLGAIGVEFSRFPTLFGLIHKFDRAALLTDTQWIKKIGEFKGMVIPGMEIKSFSLDQKAEAEAWLEQTQDSLS